MKPVLGIETVDVKRDNYQFWAKARKQYFYGILFFCFRANFISTLFINDLSMCTHKHVEIISSSCHFYSIIFLRYYVLGQGSCLIVFQFLQIGCETIRPIYNDQCQTYTQLTHLNKIRFCTHVINEVVRYRTTTSTTFFL